MLRGYPVSAILRTNDLDQVREWATHWPAETTLCRRIVLEGHWFPHDEVVDVDLRRMKRKQRLTEIKRATSA